MKKTFTLLSLIATATWGHAQSTVIDFSMVSLINVDGIYIENDTVYAAEGPTGSNIFRILPDGIVQTFASGLNGPVDITKNVDGHFYVTEWGGGSIAKISNTGAKSIFASVPDGPTGITHDAAGNLYITHNTNDGTGKITGIDAMGNVGTLSTDLLLNNPMGIDIDAAGNLYVANANNGKIIKIDTDSLATTLATLPGVGAIKGGFIKQRGGLLYVSSPYAHRIYTVSLSGSVNVFAGTGSAGHVDGNALASEFSYPKGIAFSTNSANLYVCKGFSTTDYMQVIELDLTDVVNGTEQNTILSLFPNPASTRIVVTVDANEVHTMDLKIMDLNGRLVSTFNQQGVNKMEISVEQLPTGLYTCVLEVDGITHFIKLVITR